MNAPLATRDKLWTHDQGHQVRDVHHPPRQRPPARAADDDAEQGARGRRQPVVLHVEDERPGRGHQGQPGGRPRLRRSFVGHLRVGVGHGGDARGRRQEAAALEQGGRGVVPGRPDRSGPGAGPGRDHPRQLLGRDGEQAGPAVRDGQGGLHRQAARSSASTPKCACASAAKVTAAAAPRRSGRRAWRCSALRSAPSAAIVSSSTAG